MSISIAAPTAPPPVKAAHERDSIPDCSRAISVDAAWVQDFIHHLTP